jgi:cyclase
MSKKRLIPKLQLARSANNSQKFVVVITKQFGERREIGDPVSQAKIFQDQSADELIFLNIDSDANSINKLSEVISRISEEIFMPLTVGGGVTTEKDFRLLLSKGADKISINTIAAKQPEFISIVSEKYGAQCVVVSIDYKKDENGQYFVYTNSGKVKTNLNPIEWAIQAEKFGAGEILLTCIDNDGMRNGLEIKMPQEIVKALNIPVICGGGCGLASHFSQGFIEANVEAVCAGSFFAKRDQNLIQTRSQILNSGIIIRVQN